MMGRICRCWDLRQTSDEQSRSLLAPSPTRKPRDRRGQVVHHREERLIRLHLANGCTRPKFRGRERRRRWKNLRSDGMRNRRRAHPKVLGLNRLLGAHHPYEGVEEVSRIMGARTRLGVELNRKDGLRTVTESGDGVIVEMSMRDFSPCSGQ